VTTSKRRAAIVIAVGLLIAGLWLLLRRPPVPPRDVMAKAEAETGVATMPTTESPPRRRPPPPRVPSEPPIIDEIVVEKQEVCEGEENLVTVRAHAPSEAGNAYLHYIVNGTSGQSAPVYSTVDREANKLVAKRVTVLGANDTMTMREIPAYRVKPCQLERRLLIAMRLLPNTIAEYELYARIDNVTAREPMKVASYRWDFGDGSNDETTVPYVRHDYTLRPQRTLYSSFLIRATAMPSHGGEPLVGRTALDLRNDSFEELERTGIVLIKAVLTPSETVATEDGVVRKQALLFHNHEQSDVIVDSVVAEIQEGNYADQQHPAPSRAHHDEPLDVQALAGVSRIPATGIETTVSFDSKARPEVLIFTLHVTGHTLDGFPAEGRFSLFKPPPPLTRENSTPIRDPVLSAKIQIAQQVLARPKVTRDDLWRLEQAGAFKGLRDQLRAAGQLGSPEGYSLPAHPSAPHGEKK
jgi:hypothetical protein